MTQPIAPLPYWILYFPLVSAGVFFPLSLRVFFAKLCSLQQQSRTKKRGAQSTHIKPGVSYRYNEETGRWIPLIKRPPSITKYVSSNSQIPNPKSEFSLLWPLDPGFIVTQDFQQHLQTKIEKGYKYYNGGLDLAYQDVREGAPVYAAASGVLRSASFSGSGYGNVVYIDHLTGYLTIYAHLNSFNYISAGHAVDVGDVIGYLGHSGNCWGGPGNPNGTHLHFELRCQGIPIDPMPYINSYSS